MNQNLNENTPNSDKHPLPFLQKSWVKNGLTALVLFGLFLAIRPYLQGEVVQGKAPILQLESITGTPINLQALNQQGKPVLVHIWATWCPICDLSKGGIETLAEDYAVINIATQSADDEQLLAYATANAMNPNIIVNDLDGQLMKRFGAKAVPADFVIAPNGEIAFVEVGFTTAWGLRLRLWWAGLSSDPSTQDKTP